MLKRFAPALVLVAAFGLEVWSRAPVAHAAPPGTCSTNTGYYDLSDTNNPMMYICVAPNTWKPVVPVGYQTGDIKMLLSGTCPTGWSEVSALNGKMLRGTVAANGNVGQAGGNDSYTPAGTNAAITAGTPSGTNAASATTGNCAATNIAAGTGSTTACKATAPNLAVSAQTFTGNALATHTHTFTGQAATVVPAYTNVIFCSKN